MENSITGLGTALVTPFDNDGNIDYDSFGKLIDFQIENKIDFLCVLGTTAETPTLSKAEKDEITRFAIERIDRRVPILLGCSSNNTLELAHVLEKKSNLDVDAFLTVVPYYNKPTQAGIAAHYKHLSQFTDKGIIMYNVPSRTGVNMTAQTALEVSRECSNIIGIKEASGNIHQVDEIIEYKKEGFTVLSGDDALTFPVMTLGADGVVSVVANCQPALFAQLVHYAKNREYDKALQIHRRLFKLYELLFKEGNPAGVKAALNIEGIVKNILRLPLVPVSESTYDQIKNLNI